MIVSQLKLERRNSVTPATVTMSWAEVHNGLKQKKKERERERERERE